MNVGFRIPFKKFRLAPLYGMERNQHEVAKAARAGASILLFELLQFDFPPLLEVDNDGNTPLHYVARFEPGLVDTVLQAEEREREKAVQCTSVYSHITRTHARTFALLDFALN